jgi:hypothetical protein
MKIEGKVASYSNKLIFIAFSVCVYPNFKVKQDKISGETGEIILSLIKTMLFFADYYLN